MGAGKKGKRKCRGIRASLRLVAWLGAFLGGVDSWEEEVQACEIPRPSFLLPSVL